MIDVAEFWPVARHTLVGSGRVMNFIEDAVKTPSGEMIIRQWCTHPGAVAIIAWRDDDTIMVVDQYRHPVAMKLVEPPAGLLDVENESYLSAAQRELAEEAQIGARKWSCLVDIFTSPGGIQESIRIYLATDIYPVALPDGFVVEGEEADMNHQWVPRVELVADILAGRVESPTLVSGVMALETARLTGMIDKLRPADAPWPARDNKASQDARLAGS